MQKSQVQSIGSGHIAETAAKNLSQDYPNGSMRPSIFGATIGLGIGPKGRSLPAKTIEPRWRRSAARQSAIPACPTCSMVYFNSAFEIRSVLLNTIHGSRCLSADCTCRKCRRAWSFFRHHGIFCDITASPIDLCS